MTAAAASDSLDTPKANDADRTNNTITITVLLFASAREAAQGQSQLDVTLSSSVGGEVSTETLRSYLLQHYPSLASILVPNNNAITMALNEEYVEPGAVRTLHTGDTVAIIPPISGG
jgi:molybdopterin converting factor small subunit